MSSFNFIGGSYTARSSNFDAQKTINLYPEASGSGQSKTIAMLIGTPGCKLWQTMPEYPVRGLLNLDNTTALVAAGAHLYRIDVNGVYTQIGAIDNVLTPVSMATNGELVMLVTGLNGYTVKLSDYSVTQINNDAFVGADVVYFLNGFFVFNKPGTQEFQWTSLYSTDIDALDFASAEGAPDLLVSLIVSHGELWLMGATSLEVFAGSADQDQPFQRISGAFIEQGCAAKFSVAKMDNTVIWLASDDRGTGTVQMANGYVPQRISNNALEYAIARYPKISDAIAYTYQQEGHMFYVLSFPSANATWVYDSTTSLWHERAWRNPANGKLNRHRSNCQMSFARKIIVGDWENGKLYTLDLDYYQDDGGILPAIRQCPHITNGDKWMFFSKFWIDLEMGSGATEVATTVPYTGWTFSSTTVPTFSDNSGNYRMSQGAPISSVATSEYPSCILEWSDDGGHRFDHRMTVSMGRVGERTARAIFRRLGKSRDRVWRITITDPVKRIMIGGDVESVRAIGTAA